MIPAAPFRFVLKKLVEDGDSDRSIAAKIGYSPMAVRYIRTGRTKQIHPQTALAIAELLERSGR